MKETKSQALPYVVISLLLAYLLNRLAGVYITHPDYPSIDALMYATENFLVVIQQRPLYLSMQKESLLAALVGVIIGWLMYCYYVLAAPVRRTGEEQGSAKWGTIKDAKKYASKDPDTNMILSQNVQLTAKPNELPFEYRKNCNIVVIGGSGSGKTFTLLTPNLMQLHGSYVITDPKGTVLPEVGDMFIQNGYRVVVFNTVNFSKSMHYNPLSYIRTEKDILKVITVLMENTTGKGERSGEKFWIDSERLMYQALIGWLMFSVVPEDRNMENLVAMVRACEVVEDDPEHINALDILFEELEADESKGGSKNFAVCKYKEFKLAAGKTAKSILISCASRLSSFSIPSVCELTKNDELRLNKIGDEKTAFFIIVSDTDSTFDFLVSMVISQMFNLLCDHADDDCGGKLPVPVRCMLDEFANCIGKLPDFERLISTIRSRDISVTLMVQSLAQIKSLYKDDADTIIDCCDTTIFLGGKSQQTTKTISEMMGKQTIVGRNTSESRGQSGSYSLQDQNTGRDLLDPAEVGKIPMSKEIVLMTGEKPFLDDKYKTEKHPRYSQLASSTGKYFDAAKYVTERRAEAEKTGNQQ